jgi:RNA polymerase sigma-70 factor (ECF subfamily)
VEEAETETSSLLRRWHEGDRGAFHALLVRHLPAIRDQVSRRLGPRLREKETVSDIVQDAMVEFLRFGPKFRVSDPRHFRLLLARVIENVLRDKHDWYTALRRHRDKERPLPTEAAIEIGCPLCPPVPLDQVADVHEREALVRMGMELLDPDRREILVLRRWQGLRFTEIGRRLGISEGAARKRHQRAMVRLGGVIDGLRQGRVEEVSR